MALLDRIKSFLAGGEEDEELRSQTGIGQQAAGPKKEEMDRGAIYRDVVSGAVGHLLNAGRSLRTPGPTTADRMDPLFGRHVQGGMNDPLGLADSGRGQAPEPSGFFGAPPPTILDAADRGGLFGGRQIEESRAASGLSGSNLFGDREKEEGQRLF